MDAIVRAAMAKWPNVPEVFGWLMLDARGQWRVKSAYAAPDNPRFERIGNSAVTDFISRNYEADAQGRWFFQNGPQRVYVTLARAPWVAQRDGAGRWRTHTGAALEITSVWLDDASGAYFGSAQGLAAVDDRDLEAWLACLEDSHGKRVSEEYIGDLWDAKAATPEAQAAFYWRCADITRLPLQRIASADLATRFNFNPNPMPAPGQPDC